MVHPPVTHVRWAPFNYSAVITRSFSSVADWLNVICLSSYWRRRTKSDKIPLIAPWIFAGAAAAPHIQKVPDNAPNRSRRSGSFMQYGVEADNRVHSSQHLDSSRAQL